MQTLTPRRAADLTFEAWVPFDEVIAVGWA